MSITHFGERQPGNTGNDVIRTISGDPALGYDQYNQFWVYEREFDQYGAPDGLKRWIVRNLHEEGAKCPICQRGWEPTNESLRNQTRLSPMACFAHATCLHGYRHLRDYFFWHALFCEGGTNYFGIEFKEIENGYMGPKEPPWYAVRLRHAPRLTFTVGARRHVLSISVDGLDKDWAELIERLFESVKYTKGVRTPTTEEPSYGFYVHAWTDDEARNYIRTITKQLPPPTEAEKDAATEEHYAAEREKRKPKAW